MQNTEISQHPKSTKLSLYVPNPAQAQTQCLFSCSLCTTATISLLFGPIIVYHIASRIQIVNSMQVSVY